MDAATGGKRLRLDELLVRRGLFASRSRAGDAVRRGTVSVDGRTIVKPGAAVDADAPVSVDDPASSYVARSALKLLAGLDAFGLDPAGKVALDLGASTGGFTQVLLERGARTVFAVDVGHGQLHATLRDDPRVVAIEGLNARDLTPEHMGGAMPGFLVADLSFISLRLALPPALALAAPGAEALFLVKPQFEAGRAAIGKGGIVKDAETGGRVAEELRNWLDAQTGWHARGVVPSPIEGGDGNREFLLAGRREA